MSAGAEGRMEGREGNRRTRGYTGNGAPDRGKGSPTHAHPDPLHSLRRMYWGGRVRGHSRLYPRVWWAREPMGIRVPCTRLYPYLQTGCGVE